MDEEMHMTISIPADDDGYVLLQCEHCGNFFKVSPSDSKDDGVLDIFCPCCGLTSENYATKDVIELALAMMQNTAMDMIHDSFKKVEKQFRKGPITFKAGSPPKHEAVNPIRSGIDSLELTSFSCCNRTAKVKPLLKMTGCYCPFCGVKNYEIESN